MIQRENLKMLQSAFQHIAQQTGGSMAVLQQAPEVRRGGEGRGLLGEVQLNQPKHH